MGTLSTGTGVNTFQLFTVHCCNTELSLQIEGIFLLTLRGLKIDNILQTCKVETYYLLFKDPFCTTQWMLSELQQPVS